TSSLRILTFFLWLPFATSAIYTLSLHDALPIFWTADGRQSSGLVVPVAAGSLVRSSLVDGRMLVGAGSDDRIVVSQMLNKVCLGTERKSSDVRMDPVSTDHQINAVLTSAAKDCVNP